MANDPVTGISGAITAVFRWLIFSQNPDVQARKAKNKEHKQLQTIVARVTKYRVFRREYNAIDPKTSTDIKRRKILHRRMERLDDDIDRRLGIA